MTVENALEWLSAGNRRYVAGQALHPNTDPGRRAELETGQNPFAMILSCADSRVPPELVFDCGLGDLFAVRTAGQAIDEVVIRSLEFGVHKLGVPVLVVLGHSGCGAVITTIESLREMADGETSPNILVENIRPAVETAETMDGELLTNAIRANVELLVDRLQTVFSASIAKGKLQIAGAVYHLDTGVVDWIS